mgnify:CR=1 FL=1
MNKPEDKESAAQKAHDEVAAPAWEALDEVMAPTQRAYDEAVPPALKVLRKAIKGIASAVLASRKSQR